MSLTTFLVVVFLVDDAFDHVLDHRSVRVFYSDKLLEVRQSYPVFKDFFGGCKQNIKIDDGQFPATIVYAWQNLTVIDISACVIVKLQKNQQHFLSMRRQLGQFNLIVRISEIPFWNQLLQMADAINRNLTLFGTFLQNKRQNLIFIILIVNVHVKQAWKFWTILLKIFLKFHMKVYNLPIIFFYLWYFIKKSIFLKRFVIFKIKSFLIVK